MLQSTFKYFRTCSLFLTNFIRTIKQQYKVVWATQGKHNFWNKITSFWNRDLTDLLLPETYFTNRRMCGRKFNSWLLSEQHANFCRNIFKEFCIFSRGNRNITFREKHFIACNLPLPWLVYQNNVMIKPGITEKSFRIQNVLVVPNKIEVRREVVLVNK